MTFWTAVVVHSKLCVEIFLNKNTDKLDIAADHENIFFNVCFNQRTSQNSLPKIHSYEKLAELFEKKAFKSTKLSIRGNFFEKIDLELSKSLFWLLFVKKHIQTLYVWTKNTLFWNDFFCSNWKNNPSGYFRLKKYIKLPIIWHVPQFLKLSNEKCINFFIQNSFIRNFEYAIQSGGYAYTTWILFGGWRLYTNQIIFFCMDNCPIWDFRKCVHVVYR